MNYFPEILETWQPVRLGTGYAFAEGPLWDPQGFFYFADVRDDKLYRVVPGQPPELVRKTRNGNGTTHDMQGRIIQCEGTTRRLTRWDPKTGLEDVLLDRIDGARLNRPNDVICRSDGSLLFTDPAMRVPLKDRELDAAVWRIDPDGKVQLVAFCEYPNGLAFSRDERKLYVANTRTQKYLQELSLDSEGKVVSRRIFADMSADETPGVPDGVKIDSLGRIYCTGPGGIWVFSETGRHLGTIRCDEPPVNFTFGGSDLKSLFICAHSSVYMLRVKVPGHPHPGHRSQAG